MWGSFQFLFFLYLLLGWVKVFRSGLKEHSDLLTLGDVDWQLNEGLWADKRAGILGKCTPAHLQSALYTR